MGFAAWTVGIAVLSSSLAVVSGHLPHHSGATPPDNPWESFRNLSGCSHGENRTGLAGLKKYLRQFGYLPSLPANFSDSDSFDEQLRTAVLAFQRNLKLNVTGLLDAYTVDLMSQPRCGVADLAAGNAWRGRGLYSYFPGRPTWPRRKTRLTYEITMAAGMTASSAAVREIFARAFSRWSEVTTLSFVEVDGGAVPDIRIGFYSGEHGDGEEFDGALGTLAHAFSPPDGRLHLDAAENWALTEEGGGGTRFVDLESVAVHEIGHLLGLGHSTVPEAVMYPTIRVGARKLILASDDVEGIQSLYGSNPNYNASISPPATTPFRERDTSGAGAPRFPVGPLLVAAAAAALLVL